MGFNPDKGSLTYFYASSITTYRAFPPACWTKSESEPRWRGSFGGEHFQLGYLHDVHLRYQAWSEKPQDQQRPRPRLRAMSEFYARLDPEAARLAGRVRRDSWLVYCLLVRAPELRDIARNNMGLVLAIAHQRRKRRWRFDRARRWAKHKRTAIAGHCGLPAQKPWVKLLAKIPSHALSSYTIQCLQDVSAAAPEIITELRHLPELSSGLFALLRPEWLPHLHPRLLREVGASPSERGGRSRGRYNTEGMLNDTLMMRRALGQPAPQFRSLAHLSRVHDETVNIWIERTKRQRDDAARVPFGPPPLPECEEIIGLRSPKQLQVEGQQQHNCLAASYWAQDCYDGRLYIFRVLAPERASLAIKRGNDGAWHLYEFKTRFNAEPKAGTLRAVHQWIRMGNRAVDEGWRPEAETEPSVGADGDVAAADKVVSIVPESVTERRERHWWGPRQHVPIVF